jgi:hypothetical protein
MEFEEWLEGRMGEVLLSAGEEQWETSEFIRRSMPMLVSTEFLRGDWSEWLSFWSSERGPLRWVGVVIVRRGGAAAAADWGCTPEIEKSILGRGRELGERMGVGELVKEGGGNETNSFCRSCWD